MTARKRPDVAMAQHVPAGPAAAFSAPGSGAVPISVDDGPRHFPLDRLRWSDDQGWMPNSLALLSRTHATKAIVFVHGFAGSADKTWEQFARSLRAMPEATDADAFFVEYESTTTPVPFCAAEFRGFLLDLLREPSTRVVNGSLPEGAPRRAPGATYGRIVLVGHSMGAVVARRALLELDRDELRPEERDLISMLFFAPAHKGAREIGRLVASGLGLDRLPGGDIIGALLRSRYRSVDDLTKKSDCLVDLDLASRSRREDRKNAGESWEYLRAHVEHAEADHVVYQDPFDDDRAIHPVMRENHRSICKPRDGYRAPVEAVRRLLR
jgi:pimeloyl-ACP methyl ester carboxylesterase